MQLRMLRKIDDLFDGAPQTRKTLEVKEEMLQDLMEKYNDLIAEGKSEEAAFNIAIASIGDISDLLEELGQPANARGGSFPEPDMSFYEDEVVIEDTDEPDYSQRQEYSQQPVYHEPHPRQRKASYVALAVMLYILCPVPLMIYGNMMGVVLLLAMVAAATGLLVYNNVLNGKDKQNGAAAGASAGETPYQRTERTFDPDRKMTKQEKKTFSSLSSAMWLIIVAVYFIVSFNSGAWYITWVIFLIGAAANNLLKALFDMSRN